MGAFDPTRYDERVVELVWQPWTVEVKQSSEGGYFARVVELPGCMTEADTAPEVLEALEEARAEWLAAVIEAGQEVPKPLEDSAYSGKVFTRVSPRLHRMVAQEAARQGVSMAQWVSETLAQAVGAKGLVEKIQFHEDGTWIREAVLREGATELPEPPLRLEFARERRSRGQDVKDVPSSSRRSASATYRKSSASKGGKSMAKSRKTSAKAGKAASKVLRSKSTGKTSKTAAASALSQRAPRKSKRSK